MVFNMKNGSILRDSISAINIVHKFSKKSFWLRISQILIMAIKPSASIIVLEKLVDSTQALINGKHGMLLLWMLLLVLISIFYSLATSMESYISILLEKQLNEAFSEQLLKKYQKIPYEYFENPDIQDVINKVGSQPQAIFSTLFFHITNIISILISIVTLIFVFVRVSVLLSGIFLFVIIVMVYGNIKATEYLNNMYMEQTQEERKMEYLYGLMSEKNSVLELRIFDAIEYIKEKWSVINSKILKERIRKTIYSEKYKIVSNVGLLVWVIGIMSILGFKLYNNEISLGIFTAVISSATSAVEMSKVFAGSITDISSKHLNIYCYEQFMQLSERKWGTEVLKKKEKHFIEFRNVYFVYPSNEKTIFKDFSLSFYTDEHLAIVGNNGAGKSTLIKLLVGLYRPTKGKILIDGKDIQLYREKEMMKIVSVVFQDFKEYELSVRENVSFGDIEKIHDDEKIRKAMEQGMIIDFGNDLDQPLGKLEKEGKDLSGGQWQRLAIARACIADSELVILDEPTASLDPIAENELYMNFMKLKGVKGCLIISHRLASAKIADRIIVIDKGTKVEDGSHEMLMNLKGLYYEMFSAQKAWYKNDDK
ncbi:ABC transporter ATP-binding protein [Lachnospiraceae bacterium 48-33]